MGGWRKNTGEIHNQDPQRTRSSNRKPPHGNWQPTVPAWEKQFCSSVGSVPWWKLLEAKRFMYMFKNVIQWNDSAVEEAFTNAKKRFYAEIHGLPCDISLPDPDKYIDQVDWDAVVDPKLLSDLERGRLGEVDEEDESSGRVIFGNVLLSQSFMCTGWGDTEEAFQKDSNNLCTGWGDEPEVTIQNDEPHNLCSVPQFGNSDHYAGWDHYPQQSGGPNEASGRGNHWNGNNWYDNDWNGHNSNDWVNSQHQSKETRGGTWDWNNRPKREAAGGGYNMPRYNGSRFQGHDNQTHRGWRNERVIRRDDLARQQSSWIGTY